MALATRCPHCSALFRVGAEQLKSRGGMVRCGACRQVFNAIGRLDYIEPSGPEPSAEIRADTRPHPAVPPSRPQSAAPPPSAIPAQDPPTPPSLELPGVSGRSTGAETNSTGGPQTLLDEQIELRAVDSDAADGADKESPAPAAVEVAPQFLREGRASEGRALRIARNLACVLLAPALLVQAALLFRADLIVHLPTAQPLLVALCAPLGCAANLPMRPEMLAVISSELQAVPGTQALELDVLIRNRAAFPMALPSLELTLTDASNRPLARKVFLPADYQAANGNSAALPAMAVGADLPIRVTFELPGTSASGFVAYPFYP